MFNSIPASGSSGGPAVDATARAAAASAQAVAEAAAATAASPVDSTARASAAAAQATADGAASAAASPVDATARAAASTAQAAADAAKVSADEVRDLAPPVVGQYQLYGPYGADLTAGIPSGSSTSYGRESIGFTPIYVPSSLGGIGRAIAHVQYFGGGSPNFRLGIYSTGPDGRPKDRLWQSDELAYVANGFVEVEISPRLDAAGWLFVAAVADDMVMFDTLPDLGGYYDYQQVASDEMFLGDGIVAVPRRSIYWAKDWFFDDGSQVWTWDGLVDPPREFTTDLPATLDGTWPEDSPLFQAWTPYRERRQGQTVYPLLAFLGG